MDKKLAAKIVLTLAREAGIQEYEIGDSEYRSIRYRNQQEATGIVREVMRESIRNDLKAEPAPELRPLPRHRA